MILRLYPEDPIDLTWEEDLNYSEATLQYIECVENDKPDGMQLIIGTDGPNDNSVNAHITCEEAKSLIHILETTIAQIHKHQLQ